MWILLVIWFSGNNIQVSNTTHVLEHIPNVRENVCHSREKIYNQIPNVHATCTYVRI